MTNDATINSPNTPIHLWIIGAIGLIWSAMGCFDFVMTVGKNEGYMGQFSPEELEFFYGFPAWLIGVWAVAVWGGVLGSIFLLLRKSIAFWIYVASLLGFIISVIQNYVFSNGAEIMGSPVIYAFNGAIFLISLGLVLYTRAMIQREVLS